MKANLRCRINECVRTEENWSTGQRAGELLGLHRTGRMMKIRGFSRAAACRPGTCEQAWPNKVGQEALKIKILFFSTKQFESIKLLIDFIYDLSCLFTTKNFTSLSTFPNKIPETFGGDHEECCLSDPQWYMSKIDWRFTVEPSL